MTVGDAKAIAKEWVEKRAAELPDFLGAYRVGSINHMKDNDPFPPSSDVDLRIIVNRELTPHLQRIAGEFAQKKLIYRNIILEPQYGNSMPKCEQLLGIPAAYDWSVENVVLDPTGNLDRIRSEVSRNYSEENWIIRRCVAAKNGVLGAIGWVKHPSQDFSGWNDVFLVKVAYFCYFGLAVLAQIPCIADLRGITQRKAFVFSRQTLEQYGEDQLFQSLLQILGSNGINEQQARESLSELEEAYNYALVVFRTPFRADFELCEAARPTVIGGSLNLIDRGFYREAMYRIFIERAWFQNAIENDAPSDERAKYRKRWLSLLSTLGYASEADLEQKMAAAEALIPEVMKVAEKIAEKTGK